MNWIKAMTDSINYMEEHLLDEVSVGDVAKVASSSPFHYQRMFYMLTNTSVQEYMRNRRLSLAAKELIASDVKVIDLAFKYGYESSEAFSRAFKRVHGASPTAVRSGKAASKAFPKLTIQLTIKGDESMEYTIVSKEAFKFYGAKRKISCVNGSNFVEVPKFWQDSMTDGTFDNVVSHAKGDLIGVCMPMDPEKDVNFDYVIGSFCEEPVEGLENFDVPAADWAVFVVKGPIHPNLQEAWKRIFSEWFPATGFQHAYLPEFEVYKSKEVDKPDTLTEIWIPIIKS